MAEVEASPEGPQVGAFFDLDGTLIAGFSVRHLAEDRLRRREIGVGDLVRTVAAAGECRLGRGGFEDLMQVGADGWRGRLDDDLDEMGERLFRQKIEQRIYPEMRELVRAHQRRGHTVVLSSSATSYQVEPVARFLGIEHVLCNRMSTTTTACSPARSSARSSGGRARSNAVQRLRGRARHRPAASYFYADGDEDLALMYLVGHPRPTNPGRKLASVAARRGWPVLRFTSRGSGGPTSLLRTAAGLAALGPVGSAGLALGVLTRSKRPGLNFTTSHWLDVAVRGQRREAQRDRRARTSGRSAAGGLHLQPPQQLRRLHGGPAGREELHRRRKKELENNR